MQTMMKANQQCRHPTLELCKFSSVMSTTDMLDAHSCQPMNHSQGRQSLIRMSEKDESRHAEVNYRDP